MHAESVTPSDTYRALLRPRRLMPTLVVMASLLAAELILVPTGRFPWVGLSMCVGFWALAPLCWRTLFPYERAPNPHRLLRLAAYLVIGLAFVAVFGVAVPMLLRLEAGFFTNPGSLLAVLGLFLVGGWGLAQDIDQEARVHRAERRAAALEKKARMSELLALKAHLDPHFIFNTLNAIAEWCVQDGVVAERACLDLAEVLRQLMEGVQSTLWPLSKELALAKRVLALHHARDPKRFRFTVPADEPEEAAVVPPLLLLPLVENAVKHGPAMGYEGRIAVSQQESEGHVTFCIDSPGPLGAPRPGGHGLKLVEERLTLVYGSKASFTLEAIDTHHTRATVTFPVTPPEDLHD